MMSLKTQSNNQKNQTDVSRFIAINPASELIFDIDESKGDSQVIFYSKLTIKNTSVDRNLAFQIYTETPGKYLVSPTQGILRQNEEIEVQITLITTQLRNSQGLPQPKIFQDDKFVVKAAHTSLQQGEQEFIGLAKLSYQQNNAKLMYRELQVAIRYKKQLSGKIDQINNDDESPLKYESSYESIELKQEQINLQQKKKQIIIDEEKKDDIICDICYDTLFFAQENPFHLSTCRDAYHKECLADYILSSINASKFPVLCPNFECKTQLSHLDIKLLISEDQFQKLERFYDKWTQSKVKNMTECPNPDCSFYFEMMPGDYFFICIKCHGKYCLKCKVKYHTDMTCNQFKMRHEIRRQEEETIKTIQDQRFQRCSKCQMWVERSQGCPHMTCRCGYQFCYTCGGKYGSCRCH